MSQTLEQRTQEVVTLAEKGNRSPLDATLFVLDKVHAVEDGLTSFKGDVEQDLDKLDTKIDDAVSQIKADAPNLDKVLESIRGKDATPPTNEELTALIEPLIPTVEDGKTPTTEELLSLIRPLIPKVKDGEAPSDERLRGLIEPLIPPPQAGKDADEEAIISKIENDLPKLGERIRDGLELIQEEEEKLKILAVGHLEERLRRLEAQATQSRGGGGMSQIALIQAMGKLFVHQKFSTSSATTTLTLSNKVAGSVCIWLRYQGQMLHYGDQYTVAGSLITFTFTLDNSTEVDVSYLKG